MQERDGGNSSKSAIQQSDPSLPDGFARYNFLMDLPVGAHETYQDIFKEFDGGFEGYLSSLLTRTFKQMACIWPEEERNAFPEPTLPVRRKPPHRDLVRVSYDVVVPEEAPKLFALSRRHANNNGGIENALCKHFREAFERDHQRPELPSFLFPALPVNKIGNPY